MKKLIALTTLAVILFPACRRELLSPPGEDQTRYSTVSLSLGREAEGEDSATRSLDSMEVEGFRKALCFAMDPSTGKVLVYGAGAGSLSGQPVIKSTESSLFDWALPEGKTMDIYTLVNYGSIDPASLSRPGLTRAELEALTFSSSGPAALQQLGASGDGLPMAGISKGVSIRGSSTRLTLKVKYLYAKYQLYFDTASLISQGYGIEAVAAVVENANTEVPYFQEGFRQSDSAKLTACDRATVEDLSEVQQGGTAHKITLYMLENCQGNLSGASSWTTVRRELGEDRLKRCTYLSLLVKLVRPDGLFEERCYDIYLGKTDMKSNFDVVRNYSKTLRLNLDHPTYAFVFTGGHTFPLTWGTSADIPFETTLEPGEVEARLTSGNGLQVEAPSCGTNTARVTDYPYGGTLRVTAQQGYSGQATFTVVGGNALRGAQDRVAVVVRDPDALGFDWMTASSYVGYDCRFRVSGLSAGETLAEASADGVYVASVSGDEVTFAPGRTQQTVVVSTSSGRTLEVPVTARMPSLKAPDSLLLSLDGTAVEALVRYVDGNQVLTGFNSAFYERYLALTRYSLEPRASAYQHLFKADRAAEGRFSVCTWDITGGCPSGMTLSTLTVSPALFPAIAGTETALSVQAPYTAGETDFGRVDDFSLIPPTGDINSNYLSSKGFSAGDRRLTFTISQDALGIRTDRIGGITCNDAVLSDIRSEGTLSWSALVSPGSAYGKISVLMIVSHPESGTSCTVRIGYLKVYKHLAIGGVRSAISGTGTSSSFQGAALFASAYQGSESLRYQDWPAAAVRLKDSFRAGSDHQMCITPAMSSTALETQGGVTWASLDASGARYGTGEVLYKVVYNNPGGQFSTLIQNHYSNATPFHQLRQYSGGGALGAKTDVLEEGWFCIHDYRNLYPSSRGWLRPGDNCEAYAF